MSAQRIVKRPEWPYSPDSYHTVEDPDMGSDKDEDSSSSTNTTLID